MLAKIMVLCCIACSATLQDKSELYQHWIHSHEDDDAAFGYRTYRPASYPFPPSRGRDGFEIKKNGVIISHPIAPFDGNMTIRESWTLEKEELIIKGRTNTTRFKIISITPEKLVLKPIR